jgi:hypothetical protein
VINISIAAAAAAAHGYVCLHLTSLILRPAGIVYSMPERSVIIIGLVIEHPMLS